MQVGPSCKLPRRSPPSARAGTAFCASTRFASTMGIPREQLVRTVAVSPGKVFGSHCIQNLSRFYHLIPSCSVEEGFSVLKRAMIVVTLLALSDIAAAQNSRFTVFAGYVYGNTN